MWLVCYIRVSAPTGVWSGVELTRGVEWSRVDPSRVMAPWHGMWLTLCIHGSACMQVEWCGVELIHGVKLSGVDQSCVTAPWQVTWLALCIRGALGKGTLRTYPSSRVPTTGYTRTTINIDNSSKIILYAHWCFQENPHYDWAYVHFQEDSLNGIEVENYYLSCMIGFITLQGITEAMICRKTITLVGYWNKKHLELKLVCCLTYLLSSFQSLLWYTLNV